jgi:hypothetical protein
MRFFFSGPRIFGIRPGIIFGARAGEEGWGRLGSSGLCGQSADLSIPFPGARPLLKYSLVPMLYRHMANFR